MIKFKSGYTESSQIPDKKLLISEFFKQILIEGRLQILGCKAHDTTTHKLWVF
jgi:hypothetical protein